MEGVEMKAEEKFVYTACMGNGCHEHYFLKTYVKDGKVVRTEQAVLGPPKGCGTASARRELNVPSSLIFPPSSCTRWSGWVSGVRENFRRSPGKAGCDSGMDWLRSAAELIRCHPVLFPALEQLLSHPWFDTIIKMRRSPQGYHKLIDFSSILLNISKRPRKAWQPGGGWYTMN